MFVIAIKRVRDKDGSMLKHPRWLYARGVQMTMSVTGLDDATKFKSVKDAEAWYHERRGWFSSLMNSGFYEERSLSIREVKFKWMKNLY